MSQETVPSARRSLREAELHDGPEVSVVIVSWNTADLLQRSLESVRDHWPTEVSYEVIVVDNASDDGSPKLVHQAWPAVHLVENEVNEGYQRANNRGMSMANGRYLLLLNADAMLTQGSVQAMLHRLRVDPGAGIVGPRLVYGDGSWQRWTAGNDPQLLGAVAFFLFGERFSGYLARRSLWLASDVAEPRSADWVSSACLLLRRTVLDDAGFMDERFFAYMDDVDLCHKARQAGWTVWYQPTTSVVHLMGQSTKRQTGAASPAALRNFNRYFALRHGQAPTVLLQAIEAVGFTARAAAHATLAMLQPRRLHHRRQVRDNLRNVRIALEAAVPPSPVPSSVA
jgi:GT2 family glycosyltransferase